MTIRFLSSTKSTGIRNLRRRAALTLFAICFGALTALAAEIRIQKIETLPDQKFRLTIQDTGLGALNLVPSYRFNLNPGSTSVLSLGSRISEVGPGVFETIVPGLDPSSSFFRIAGFFAPDSDADGLSDALETIAGTSTNTFDTDGDGFGDANEIVNGSDPLVTSSVPNVIKANFSSPQSSAREGDGTLLVPFTLSRSFTGQVRYSVAAMSTAASGTDFVALTGTIDVNGTSAAIPIVLVDDLALEDVKLLVIDLENDPDFVYQTGGASRHSILLRDNDSYWSGVLRNDASEQAFRMRMLRQGTSVQAALVSNFDTNDTAAMRGVGSIPPGVWNMTSATLTTNTFTAASVPIPMGASTLFGESALNRTLTFDANPAAVTNYLFRPNLIIGTFTDRLSPVSTGLQYLAQQTSGMFVLMEELPTLPFPDLPSVPSPAPPPPLAALQTTEARQ